MISQNQVCMTIILMCKLNVYSTEFLKIEEPNYWLLRRLSFMFTLFCSLLGNHNMPARHDVQEWVFLIDDLVSTRLGLFLDLFFYVVHVYPVTNILRKCYLFFSSIPLLFKIKDNQKTLFSPYYPIITVFYKAGNNGCMVASQDDQPNIF